MRIQPLGPVTGFGKKPDLDLTKPDLREKTVNAGTDKQSDVYVPGKKENFVIYGKAPGKYENVSIERLKEESEQAYASLRQIVIELLERQGYSAEKLKAAGAKGLEVDETARAEAARLIADDGPLGPEAVSNRIVDFALALSGGDKAKLDKLKSAIDQGFKQVKEMLGGVPEVSLKTYDLIMEKLEKSFA